jgi:superfamily I DNA/RNA helicase
VFGIKNKITLTTTYRKPGEPNIALLTSVSDEVNYIAHQFRSAHLLKGVPYSQMAVVLRSPGAQVSALVRAFASSSIPVEIDAAALSLADNPAIKPIITIAQIALGELKLIPGNWEQI